MNEMKKMVGMDQKPPKKRRTVAAAAGAVAAAAKFAALGKDTSSLN